MTGSETFNYEGYPSQPAAVKVEPDLGLSLLHSPPSSRSSSSIKHSSSSSRLRRKASSRSDLSVMTHPYGNWPSASLKSEHATGPRSYSSGPQLTASSRRGGNGDQQTFTYADSYSQSVRCRARHSHPMQTDDYAPSIIAEVLDTPIQARLWQDRVSQVPWGTLV
jgi:hypothetical protein